MAISTVYTRLVANARVRLPGALDDPLKYELFNALDEFLSGSDIWREAIDVPTVAGQSSYYIEPDDAGSSIVRLVSFANVDGIPVGATMAEVGTVVINQVPVDAQVLTATVSLTTSDPTRTDGYPKCPEWILQKYWLGLLDGLLSRMMMQAAKPYSNDKLASYHGLRFIAVTARAATDARTTNLYGGQAWRFPAFA